MMVLVMGIEQIIFTDSTINNHYKCGAVKLKT